MAESTDGMSAGDEPTPEPVAPEVPEAEEVEPVAEPEEVAGGLLVEKYEMGDDGPVVVTRSLCPGCAGNLTPSSPGHCVLCGWDLGDEGGKTEADLTHADL